MSLKKLLTTILIVISFICNSQGIFIVSKGASADSSVFSMSISNPSDSLIILKKSFDQNNLKDKDLKVYDTKTGKYTGTVNEFKKKYSVVGSINEYQLSISCLEFEIKNQFCDTNGILDKNNLITQVLQQSRSAREAIANINRFISIYGYYGKGLTININDQHESWILELCPKGKKQKGGIWVALKIPNGYVSLLRPISRIQNFPMNDKENCLYSPDYMNFINSISQTENQEQNFRNTFAEFTGDFIENEEIKIHAFYEYISSEEKFESDFSFFKSKNDLPLWVKPDFPISLYDVMQLSKFIIENNIANNDNFCTITQARFWLPNFIGGVLWAGTINSNIFAFNPIYSGISMISDEITHSPEKSESFNTNQIGWLSDFISTGMIFLDSTSYNKLRLVFYEQQENIFRETIISDNCASEKYLTSAKVTQDYLNSFTEEICKHSISNMKKNAQYLKEQVKPMDIHKNNSIYIKWSDWSKKIHAN